ncbi:MAG: hypothetical protein V1800_08195 [Candidatus Latescibacterota bacterium]
MTQRERFHRTLHFEKADDRLPMLEWAAWWDKTFDRWKAEGLRDDITIDESLEYFGLDNLVMIAAIVISGKLPRSPVNASALITDEDSYERIRPFLFGDESIESLVKAALDLKAQHDR